MASIKMIAEEEATGKVKEIYEDINSCLGIDFGPQSLQGHGFQTWIFGSELEQGQNGDGRARKTRPLDEGDYRRCGICRDGL